MAGEEWGEGDHTHPIPASEGVGDHSPPLGGDHNFPLLEMRDPHGAGLGPRWAIAAAREGELGSDSVMTASSLLAAVRAQAGGL